ncbi:hypothetical protein Ct9H90mP29_03180 [bacterium]|nr:MAG: hypothetical protein Ct9H90mP29_03180 [bacterium]
MGYHSPRYGFFKGKLGIMVYEEQVSMAAMTMAGLGYAEAESLRKTMSRDSMQHLFPSWKQKFMDGAQRRGYSSNMINDIGEYDSFFCGIFFLQTTFCTLMRCFLLPVPILRHTFLLSS